MLLSADKETRCRFPELGWVKWMVRPSRKKQFLSPFVLKDCFIHVSERILAVLQEFGVQAKKPCWPFAVLGAAGSVTAPWGDGTALPSAITTYFLGENGLQIVFNIVDDNFSGFITCFLFTVWLPAPLPSASPLIHLLLSQHSSLHLLLIFILLPS